MKDSKYIIINFILEIQRLVPEKEIVSRHYSKNLLYSILILLGTYGIILQKVVLATRKENNMSGETIKIEPIVS